MRIALLLPALMICAPVFAAEDPIVFMSDDEPAMKRAFSRAQETLDGFLKLAAEKPPELGRFTVKVGIAEGTEVEYIWITDFAQLGDRFTGKIGNTPQLVKSVTLHQVYEFKREQIVDWLYLDRPKRKMMGNFTYCALLTKEPPAQAEAARKRFNLDCD